MTIIDLDTLVLKNGGHANFEQGACLLEAASYIAGEHWSDHPKCVSPVLGSFGRNLNDRLGDEDRQKLKPFIHAMLNTAGDGQDKARGYMAVDWAVRVSTPRWLDAAGLTDHAAALRALAPIVDESTARAARIAARAARDDAWKARETSRAQLTEKIKAELLRRGKPVAVADAVAVAVAVADADAVAVAVAVADAVAVAVADAVAVAVAVADAAAVAVAVADAAADAAADADADFSYGSAGYWKVRDAVYKAFRTGAIAGSKFTELRDLTNQEAIDLFGRMINPAEATR